MSIRKMRLLFWLVISLSFSVTSANALSSMGQTIQINTHFRSVAGKPVWLLILRDADTGVVVPYMYDIRNNDNFWLAFSYGRNYIVTASDLKFGPFAVIHNFCHLQGGIMRGVSMIITLSGHLTPVPVTFKCHVVKYNDNAFSIAPTP